MIGESIVSKILKEATEEFFNDPVLNHFWYHGTSMTSAMAIIKDGKLKPSSLSTNEKWRNMSPQKGKVYLSANVMDAINYAYFRADKKGAAIIIIDTKNLKNFEPDEDIIADLLPAYKQDKDGNHEYQWLRNKAELYYPKILNNYDEKGGYTYGTQLGKLLIKKLNNSEKEKLIQIGYKIAAKGNIKISEVWQLPAEVKDWRYIINENNFKELSKRIK